MDNNKETPLTQPLDITQLLAEKNETKALQSYVEYFVDKHKYTCEIGRAHV